MSSSRVQPRLLGPIECMVMGSGPPLVLLPGLSPENGRPSGLAMNGELQTMAPYAKHFTTYWIGRPKGLRRGTTFAEITASIASALRGEFGQPVNVLGISTGGSLAQQLAAEHPELVRRLVLVSTGYRLGDHAAQTQRAMIRIAEAGNARRVMAAFGWDVIPRWRGRTLAAAVMYATGLRLYPQARDTHDLLVMLEAEDAFDLSLLPPIAAPTLILNGGRDQFYERSVIDETHRLIPRSRLSIYPRRGHITVVSDKAALAEAISFLR